MSDARSDPDPFPGEAVSSDRGDGLLGIRVMGDGN